jgi:hypothetical protein
MDRIKVCLFEPSNKNFCAKISFMFDPIFLYTLFCPWRCLHLGGSIAFVFAFSAAISLTTAETILQKCSGGIDRAIRCTGGHSRAIHHAVVTIRRLAPSFSPLISAGN